MIQVAQLLNLKVMGYGLKVRFFITTRNHKAP